MKPITPDAIRSRAFARKSVRLGIGLWLLMPVAVVVVVGGVIIADIDLGPTGQLTMLVVTVAALISTVALVVVTLLGVGRRIPRISKKLARHLARGERAPHGSHVANALVWTGALASFGMQMWGLSLLPSAAPMAILVFGGGLTLVLLPVAAVLILAVVGTRVLAPIHRARLREAQTALDRNRWWMAGALVTLHQGTLCAVRGEAAPAEVHLRGWLGRWTRGALLPYVLENLAWTMIRTQRWEDAEEVLEALVDLDPTRGATFAQLGVLDLERRTADERTIEWLELALELNLRGPLRERPRTEEIRSSLAWGQATIGRASEARRLLAEVDVESGAPLSIAGRCLRLGRACLALDDVEQANTFLERVVSLAGQADVARRAESLMGRGEANPTGANSPTAPA